MVVRVMSAVTLFLLLYQVESAVCANAKLHREADAAEADEEAERSGGYLPGNLGPDPAANEETRGQRSHKRPPDIAEQREANGRHGIRHAREGVLHRVDLDQRLLNHGAEHHQQHDSRGGTEITDVHRDGEQGDAVGQRIYNLRCRCKPAAAAASSNGGAKVKVLEGVTRDPAARAAPPSAVITRKRSPRRPCPASS